MLAAAVACLRQKCRSLANPLAQEMERLAGAIEQGTLRLRGRVLPMVEKPSTPTMRIMATLQVGRGRSKRGYTRAVEEIEDEVLKPFQFRREDGFDYSLIVPYESAEDLDRTMTELIPAKARLIAARRHCSLDYSARSMDEPVRVWTVPIPPAPPQTRRTELELSFFPGGRRGKPVVQEIETRVLGSFPFEKLHDKKAEYRLAVLHKTNDELQRIVSNMLDAANAIAHERGVIISYELYHPEFSWSGRLS